MAAALSHEVRPGLRFRPQDFYYGDELDEAILQTIGEESSSYYDSSSSSDSDDLDDETALAIAVQESLESAKREELQRSYRAQASLSRSRPVQVNTAYQSHVPFPTTSVSGPDLTSVSRSQPRQRPSPTPSKAPSPRLSLVSSVTSAEPSSSGPRTPVDSYSSSRARSITRGSATPTSRYIDVDLDEMARKSRRTSMAAASQVLRRTMISQRSRDGSRTPHVSVSSRQSDSTLDSQSEDLHAELMHYEKLFFPTQLPPCMRCGGQTCVLASRDRDRSSFKLHSYLHIICSVPECGQTYCRGCLKPRRTRCSSQCSSSSSSRLCPTVSCCDLARVIAVFEVLRHLEEVYLTTSPTNSNSNMSTPSSSPKRSSLTIGSSWQDRAEGLFNLLHSLLSYPTSSDSTSNSHKPNDSDSDDEEVERFWTFVAPLLELSLLCQILATLLRNASVKLWVAQGDLYLSVLRLLRTLTDSPERRVKALFMNSPTAAAGRPTNGSRSSSKGRSSQSIGIGPSYGISRWARERSRIYDTTSSTSSSSSTVRSGSYDSLKAGLGGEDSLYAIISGLDAHRMALIDMRERIQFPPTVEKLWGLADGLMYLVLQGLLWY
ncbi:hypothetical protein K435DRAFT_879229 [Dendrothele bispora CBS 962.96]|uniref:Uncharacterized protein n=1 Tax=Dendrothele bispora (strain CBS 962.96) TaxID=1314807 RepID=A0A4S8KLU5_DENBC|nr:hypothetical protein K435DRAFT_879229 [Dendrothele bispora CBS 962.96]